MRMVFKMVFAIALLCHGITTYAKVEISGAWVRATVPVQKVSGAFMRIVSGKPVRLVGATADVAGQTEIHQSTMVNDRMRMREVSQIDLQPGTALMLEPGGYHIMLLQLKRQLKAGDTVNITLQIEAPDGARSEVPVAAVVQPIGASGPASAHQQGDHGKRDGHGAHGNSHQPKK